MKASKLLAVALLVFGLAFVMSGCAHFRSQTPRPMTFALVVSVAGGQAPTEAQWAELQKKFATYLAARGCALVSDPALADRIVHVQYTPDSINPEDPTLGTALVVSVKSNALAFATAASSSSSSSYVYPINTFRQTYTDSYDYYTPTNVVYHPGLPPAHNHPAPPSHPNKPDDHPPGTPPPHHPPVDFVGNYPVHITPQPGDGHRPHPRDDSGNSRSDSSYSRSDSNYSRSDSGSSSSSYSSSSSSDSSSYSSSSSSSSGSSYTPAMESANSSGATSRQPY